MADSLMGNIKQYAQNTIDNAKGKVQEIADNPEDADYINYQAGYYADDGTTNFHMEYWSEDIRITKKEQDAVAKERGNWLAGIDRKHQKGAKAWQSQAGVMKIVPIFRIQRFSHTLISDIMDGKIPDPKTQVIPVSNVSVTPHNISFNFFDTTEGKIGVSNAVENHMVVECDIYLTELIYYWWNHSEEKAKELFGYNELDISDVIFSNKKPKKLKHTDRVYPSMTKAQCKKLEDIINKHKDFEQTAKFAKFRNTFLTYYTGWRCHFVSHLFPTFYGSITDIKYDISEGESSAKWHIKIEEAIFYEGSRDGTKKTDDSSKTGTSGGSGSDSGAAGTGSDSSDDGNGGSGQ